MLQKGFNVTLAGFDHLRSKSRRKSPGINQYDIIIAPIPFTIDDLTLYSPYSEDEFHIEDFFSKAKKNSKIIGGPFKKNDPRLFDITKNRNFIELNILPICEELIKIAIENTNITIIGSNITIYGYGKIAKRLYKQLEFLGAYVHIKSDKENIEAPSSSLDSLDYLDTSDIIIHTQNSYTIDRNELQKVKNEVLIIDAVTSDYGVNYKYAKKQNINVIKARGLSGKSAPKTVADYIFNTIKRENLLS